MLLTPHIICSNYWHFMKCKKYELYECRKDSQKLYLIYSSCVLGSFIRIIGSKITVIVWTNTTLKDRELNTFIIS